ncbi:hypothetical protein Psch_02195 [Pelotomaculum schinkii]|uniref:Uncharacterized protein n=1 Tax=Pelotomaculum schinkii TaxID=78350 RepID=A0A4Y7RIT0_9FIRM|nr:hypothetical protein [Pelotomaculum schinkii]TEB08629.1 hypothetical protein Psch_02195 [Pelotomaculum schinkii]
MVHYKKIFLPTSEVVTNGLIFLEDTENFFSNDGEMMKLSSGQIEKIKPLPIVRALTTELFKTISGPDLDNLKDENNPDETIIPRLIVSAQEKLKINLPYPELRQNDKSLRDYWSTKFDPPRKPGAPPHTNPLTSELLALAGEVIYNLGPGRRKSNSFFNDLFIQHRSFLIKDQACYDRVSEVKFYPTFTGDDYDMEVLTLRHAGPHNAKLVLIAQIKDIISAAWVEIMFARMFNLRLGLCAVCGRTFVLGGKKGKGNYSQSTCPDPECKKAFTNHNIRTGEKRFLDKARQAKTRKKIDDYKYQNLLYVLKNRGLEEAEKFYQRCIQIEV